VFTGYLTYGIYLWHYPIIMTRWNDFAEFSQRVAKDLNWGLWQTMVMFHSLELVFVIVLSYVLAYTTFVLVEARFRPSLYSELSKKK
jgi:peptidoglycan/LPS O-acetylase OafA/YrhL